MQQGLGVGVRGHRTRSLTDDLTAAVCCRERVGSLVLRLVGWNEYIESPLIIISTDTACQTNALVECPGADCIKRRWVDAFIVVTKLDAQAIRSHRHFVLDSDNDLTRDTVETDILVGAARDIEVVVLTERRPQALAIEDALVDGEVRAARGDEMQMVRAGSQHDGYRSEVRVCVLLTE